MAFFASKPMRRLICAVAAAIYVAVSAVPVLAQDRPAGAEARENAPVACDRPYKYCSYYVPGNWRATTWVPAGWTALQCEDLGRRAMGATGFQLFCIGDNGCWAAGAGWSSNPGANQLPPGGNQCNWRLQ